MGEESESFFLLSVWSRTDAGISVLLFFCSQLKCCPCAGAFLLRGDLLADPLLSHLVLP